MPRNSGETMNGPTLTGQTIALVLSATGIAFLFICLLLIAFNRVPTLKSPQVIKALGIELDVSIITVLVLVGFTLSVSSIYMQVKNYEGQIADTQGKLEALNVELRRAGKATFSPFVVLEDVSKPEQMPRVSEVVCSYVLVNGGNTSSGNGRLSPGVSANSFQITLDDIPLSAEIRRIEIAEKQASNSRTWIYENLGYPLSPSLIMHRVPR
jgi:hypothetical protein